MVECASVGGTGKSYLPKKEMAVGQARILVVNGCARILVINGCFVLIDSMLMFMMMH